MMKKWTLNLLLMLVSLSATAQTQAEIDSLTKEMYRLYPQREIDEFMRVTDRLKEAARKAGDLQTFYKAWSNQASYSFTRVSRHKGMEIIKEVHDYASAHNEKFGLYTSSVVNAGMMSTLHHNKEAEKGYHEAINYLHQYFPGTSTAPCYLGLAKIYFNEDQPEKVREYAKKALAEADVILQHQLSAWSYLCMSYFEKGQQGNVAEFNRCYEERGKVKAAFGHDDDFGEVVDFLWHLKNGRYEEAFKQAEHMRSPIERLKRMSDVYSSTGDYRSALSYYKQFIKVRDSINNVSVSEQTAEYAVELDVARTKMDAQLSRERTQHIFMLMLGVMAVLVIGFLAFILWRHSKHMKEVETAYDKMEDAYEKLEDAYSKLEVTTTDKQRIESELQIARDIQMDMVPHVFPAFPERADIDLYASMVPAKSVGGDLYDFFLQSGKLYFCIGDVSGKGVPSALFMSVVVNLFRLVAKEGFPPEYVATRLNDTLATDNGNGMFCTMFIGMIDLHTGRLSYCNAGHNPPLIIDRPLDPHQPCRPAFFEMESNAPIGLMPDLEFVGESIESVKGRTLFLYTDGLNEAENSLQEQFGDDRLFDFFKKRPYDNASQTVDLMNSAVKVFVGDHEPSDDLTMLCIRIT